MHDPGLSAGVSSSSSSSPYDGPSSAASERRIPLSWPPLSLDCIPPTALLSPSSSSLLSPPPRSSPIAPALVHTARRRSSTRPPPPTTAPSASLGVCLLIASGEPPYWGRPKTGKTVDWTSKDLLHGLEEFVPIYETRPVKNNMWRA
ncbi:hypothetical protein GUJ93_ZPchr0008g13209 [Zizania palustris]|uniref:Uncharacterized protein n=1 Tax=Zizania palustris TaxID=103762 RepID=A0A8J5RED6_ZIZPA|nr:hypothetical protein GUJ93_ZPchr0008g13209 [Zizania palustris]